MKPKNRVMCPDCGRAKMLFETEKEANTFLKFNMDAVNPDGTRTMRVYYCPACCGYHISSHEYTGDGKKTERLIKAYHVDIQQDKSDHGPNVEACLLVEAMVKQQLKTRSEVNQYLRTRKDLPDWIRAQARLKYYKEYNIKKGT